MPSSIVPRQRAMLSLNTVSHQFLFSREATSIYNNLNINNFQFSLETTFHFSLLYPQTFTSIYQKNVEDIRDIHIRIHSVSMFQIWRQFCIDAMKRQLLVVGSRPTWTTNLPMNIQHLSIYCFVSIEIMMLLASTIVCSTIGMERLVIDAGSWFGLWFVAFRPQKMHSEEDVPLGMGLHHCLWSSHQVLSVWRS